MNHKTNLCTAIEHELRLSASYESLAKFRLCSALICSITVLIIDLVSAVALVARLFSEFSRSSKRLIIL